MKPTTLLFVLLCNSIFVFAQDSHFTQYQSARGYLNPAMVGTDSTLVLSTGYRGQWPKIDGTYKTFRFSADKYVRLFKGGLGIDFIYDNAASGTLITNGITLNYAPHFELFKNKLVVQSGIGFGLMQKSIDWSKLTFGDMIDPQSGFVYNTNEVPGTSQKSFLDINAGIFIYSKSIYGGFAIHHLTEPDEGLIGPSKLPRKLTLHAGANLYFKKDVNHNFILSPNILYMQQQDFHELMPGITLKYKFIVAGFSYRNEDAFNTYAGLQFNFFKVGYSYDYTTSLLTNRTGGSHEIQLAFFIHRKKNVCKIKTIRMI